MTGTIARPFLCIPRDFMSKGFSHQEIGWFMDLISRAQYTRQTVINGGHEQPLLPGQLCDAVSFFVDRWKVTRDKVMRFIKKLVAFSYLLVEKPAHQSKKAANIITVCHLTGKPRSEATEEDSTAHQPHINRTSTAHKYKKGEGIQEKKEDSCQSQAPDESEWEDPFEAAEQSAGAGSSNSVPPEPEPSAAPDGAGPPKSSAKKVPARSPEFMAAWNAMPKFARQRSSLKLAEPQWNKLTKQERADAVRAIKLWEDNQYAKGAHLWLRDHLFEGLLDAGGVGPKPAYDAMARAYDEAPA